MVYTNGNRSGRRRPHAIAGVLVTVLLAACTSAAPTAAPTSAPSTAPTTAPTAEPTPEETLSLAYLSFAVANSYDAPMLAAA